jgi:hypothetical protein
MLCVMGGANWNNSLIAGPWARNLNNARSTSNNNYGFSSDSSPQAAKAGSGIQGGAFLRLAQAFAKSAGRPHSSRHHVVLDRLGAFP